MQHAQDLIQHLRSEVLQMDPEWSVDIRGGFSWWPHQQRQDMVCDRVRKTEEGTRLERVCVSTEAAWLKPGAAIPDGFVSVATQLASVSGLVRRSDSLRLHARAWVDESNVPLDTVIRPLGADDPPWSASIFANLREEYLDGPPRLLATSGEQGQTAEFSFGTGPFFGSWAQAEDGRIDFITFVPNAPQRPNAAANFILIAPGRAGRMSILWFNEEKRDEEGCCRAKTAIERAIPAGELDLEKL